jgi:hypothetical protein
MVTNRKHGLYYDVGLIMAVLDGLQLLFYAKNGNKITNKQIESGPKVSFGAVFLFSKETDWAGSSIYLIV